MNQKWVIAAFLALISLNIFIIYSPIESSNRLSTFASFFDFLFQSSGSVAQLFVQVTATTPNITIYLPLNTSYFFNQSQAFNMSLNVSAVTVGSVQAWWYTLYNATNSVIYNNIIFTPNTSFIGVLGSNKLAVYANTTNGVTGNRNVTFSIQISQASPIIEDLSPNILACEDSFLSHIFNITDADEDSISVSMTPLNPFFISKLSQTGNRSVAEIFSGVLPKSRVGTYSENVSASDGTRVDTENTNITVVPVNHVPRMDLIGTQTIWYDGTFYRAINANDTEDGNVTGGNLTFNLTFLSGNSIFSINSSTGIINYTTNSSALGIYSIQTCVIDKGLNTTIYPNATFCGYSGSPSYNCTTFQLTITDQNRPPNITAWYPVSLQINGSAPTSFTFNISKSDPDGTTPDAYWSVDNQLQLSISDWFNRSFPTGGTFNVSVRLTDGELNDSLSWSLNIQHITGDPPTGGGGGGSTCEERWVCDETAVCQDPYYLYQQKLLNDVSKGINDVKCKFFGWGDSECGIKFTSCMDINLCGSTRKKPNATEACYYVPNPSCTDSVQNCHDSACEVLVDCGGPCGACPTCNDKIQNQNEEGVDCGGPCPSACPVEKPSKTNYLIYILLLLILLLLIAIAYTIYRMFAIRKRIEENQY